MGDPGYRLRFMLSLREQASMEVANGGGLQDDRLFWPLLKGAQGHVINIIGGAARTIEPEFLIGGAVNAAAANFTKGLSRLGTREGVHVNAIHPGQTATERTEQLIQQRAAAQGK